ncbi:hypothetical protein [Chelativorans sp. YIM 93263]|uniref:hypothetical protein n=1 Tax=Chelativorans sp. YIM 93263 TaxID=2906648 RepID=UPI0023784A51|nr:hypothetical protein [Chelativorans sp. YIM 93263]
MLLTDADMTPKGTPELARNQSHAWKVSNDLFGAGFRLAASGFATAIADIQHAGIEVANHPVLCRIFTSDKGEWTAVSREASLQRPLSVPTAPLPNPADTVSW